MEGELADLLQKFSLEGNELLGAVLEVEDLQHGVRACEDSIIGRIIGEKVSNFTGVKSFVASAWGYPRNMTVIELGPNVFQFNIPNADEKEKIVTGGPWVIDNQILVLKRWSEGIEEDYSAFMVAPLWVQLWNVPIHWLSKEVGKKVGSVFEGVSEVIVPQSGGKEGRHLKILAQVDLSKPLLRGTVVKIAGVLKWVGFKYERCPDFCYSCGFVSHSERTCKERRVLGGSCVENQYGPWMRAGTYKASPQNKPSRPSVVNDRRYWSYRNGDLVEQESSRTKLTKCLLEKLLTTENGGVSSRGNSSVRVEDGMVQETVAPLFEQECKMASHSGQESQLSLGKENHELSLVPQAAEAGKNLVEVETMEEDSEAVVKSLNQNQEVGSNEETEGTFVINQESLCVERVGVEVVQQAKRTFRRLKSQNRTRIPLTELNGRGGNHIKDGKRKCLVRDEEMEEASSELVHWKKSKPLEELYSTELRGEEEGPFLKGAPIGV